MKSVTTLDLQTITPNNAHYPTALKTCTAFKQPPDLSAIHCRNN